MTLRTPKVGSVPMRSSQCCVDGTESRLGEAAIGERFHEVRSGGGDGLETEVCILVDGKSVRRRSYIWRCDVSVLSLRLIYARVRVFHLFVLVRVPANRRFLRSPRHRLRGVIPAEQTQRRESCCHDKVEPNPR